MATSREPLRIAGESEFDLPPMDEGDAVTLFIERAQAVRADVGDSPAVHELIRRLDGLPLAIELAAARVKLLGPEQLLERIAQRLDLLKGGRDADERHATLRATIGWSYDLLDDDERQLFARLAVFRGGCTLEAAEAVCDSNLDTLASLLDKSLVRRRTDANGEERFWMLETIREFAWERLEASGEEDALRRLQTDWLLELADRAGTRATVGVPGKWDVEPRRARDRQRARRARLGVGARPRARPRPGRVARGVLARSRAEPRARHVSSHCSHEPPDAEPELRAHALRALGGALQLSGDPERAAPCYQRSLELFIASGDEVQTANLRYRVAANMVDNGDTAAAWPLLEESLRIFRQLGLPSRRGPGTRIPLGQGLRRRRSGARDRAFARERRHRPRFGLGHGGRQASSVVQPGSSASAAASMPRRIMPSGRSSSLSASGPAARWCSLPPSWRFSPPNAGTPSGQGGFGALSRAN